MRQSNNTSGQPGVFYNIDKKKWVAMIGYKKQRIYLGLFDTVEKAIEARKKAEKKYGATDNTGLREPDNG